MTQIEAAPPASTGVATSRRVVVLTGASAGVGRATAHALARNGDAIGLIARRQEALEETLKEVEALGGRGLVLPADVADADAVDAAAALTEAELGPIDVWINNAMVSVFAPVSQTTAAEIRRVTEVTYLGYVHGTLAALHRMRDRDRGVIVQVGSALAYRGIPLQAAYCAAKHAIQGFTESLRCELLHDGSGVRVTMVQLPALNTPQFDWVRSRLPGRPQPVPPIFQPEIAADAILWAIDHERRELNVGASSDLAIIGNKIAPGLLDRYLANAAYEGQQTAEPEDAGRADNLYEPVPGLHRTRGRFDNRARDTSPHLWLATHRALVAGAAAATTAVGLAGARLLRGR